MQSRYEGKERKHEGILYSLHPRRHRRHHFQHLGDLNLGLPFGEFNGGCHVHYQGGGFNVNGVQHANFNNNFVSINADETD